LPPALKEATHLERLLLTYNELDSLPDELGELKRLRYLSIAHNNFSEIPACLAGMSALKGLDIAGNGIDELPPFMTECTALTTIFVESAAQCTAIEASASSLFASQSIEVVRTRAFRRV
jgi:internalin A